MVDNIEMGLETLDSKGFTMITEADLANDEWAVLQALADARLVTLSRAGKSVRNFSVSWFASNSIKSPPRIGSLI